MPKFLDKLCVTEVDDRIWAICDHPFRYQSDVAGQIITVPVGFYTDFASVPRWLPVIYALLGDTGHGASVVHDWLYYSAITDREVADRVIREAAIACGVSAWKANLFYRGVHMGGWKAWSEHRKQGHPEDGKFSSSPDIKDFL